MFYIFRKASLWLKLNYWLREKQSHSAGTDSENTLCNGWQMSPALKLRVTHKCRLLEPKHFVLSHVHQLSFKWHLPLSPGCQDGQWTGEANFKHFVSFLFFYLQSTPSPDFFFSFQNLLLIGEGDVGRACRASLKEFRSLILLTLGKTSGYTHHLSPLFVIVLFGLCFN